MCVISLVQSIHYVCVVCVCVCSVSVCVRACVRVCGACVRVCGVWCVVCTVYCIVCSAYVWDMSKMWNGLENGLTYVWTRRNLP